MFFYFYDQLCFEVMARKRKDLDYLRLEFPDHRETAELSSVCFRVEFSDRLRAPSTARSVGNGKYRVRGSRVFRQSLMKVVPTGYSLDFGGEKISVFFPKHLFSQRLLLLRLLYPLMRPFLLQKNALLLKGSCTADGDRAFFYTGDSGSGKTNAVLSDLAAGRQYVSDTLSIIDLEGRVFPLHNALHVFQRNKALLKKALPRLGEGAGKVLAALWLRKALRAMTFKKYELSLLVKIPPACLANGKKNLAEMALLSSSSGWKTHPDPLRFLFGVNEAECSEFNPLLEALREAGIMTFAGYWPDFREKLALFLERNVHALKWTN